MKEELRMYVLVPYNLSPIQQGIQAAHAIAELGLDMSDNGYHGDANGPQCTMKYMLPDNKYYEWAREYKTIVILNSGTTGKYSSMDNHRKNLDKLDVTYSTFREPDLNDAMTAIAFVVDMKEDSHIVGYLKQMRLA